MSHPSLHTAGPVVKTRLIWNSAATPTVRATIAAWFTQHGLTPPPGLIAGRGSGWVEVDHTRHTIEWPHGECSACTHGNNGQKVWPGCDPVTTTEQNEADPRPLPFVEQLEGNWDTYRSGEGYQVVFTRELVA